MYQTPQVSSTVDLDVKLKVFHCLVVLNQNVISKLKIMYDRPLQMHHHNNYYALSLAQVMHHQRVPGYLAQHKYSSACQA